MSEPKFTEGEWEVEGHGGIHMDGSRDGYTVCANGKRIQNPYLTEADASLIAAAPEMYAALEELTKCLSGNADSMANLPDAHSKARTALAKARGER